MRNPVIMIFRRLFAFILFFPVFVGWLLAAFVMAILFGKDVTDVWIEPDEICFGIIGGM